jgi:fructoselysine-6-P-deglycase FrlB-like protein
MNQPGFQSDILAEPATLEAMLTAYAGPSSPAAGLTLTTARRVVMIGMGSSCFAAQTACVALRSRGIDAHAELASTAAPFPPSADTVAVGISASGRSAETVEALARHHGTSTTIAITNYPDRDVAAVADRTLPLLAGVEAGGVSCRSFQTTLALLALLGGHAVDELRPAVEAAQAIVDGRAGWLGELAERAAAAHTVYTIAPVERLSSALEAALMFREGPRLAADATETGDWLHVDVYLSKHTGYTALLFPGSRYDAEVMRWADERGSQVIAVGPPVAGAVQTVRFPHAHDPLVASLVETMVTELAASELWRRAATA